MTRDCSEQFRFNPHFLKLTIVADSAALSCLVTMGSSTSTLNGEEIEKFQRETGCMYPPALERADICVTVIVHHPG